MVQYTFSLLTFEYFLLVFVRIASFMVSAPFFGMQGVPITVRNGFSAVVAIMVVSVLKPPEVAYGGVIAFSVLVVKEAITGLIIGYMAYVCNTIVIFAGNIIDMDIGFSMASEFDPTMNTQMTVTGQMYYYFMMLLLLVSDMHRYILRAVIDSFSLIPLGGAEFKWDSLLVSFTKYMTDSFIIAFRIIMPVFCVMLVTNAVLGIMAKVAPQMNMFSVGMQIKIMIGLAIIFLVIFLFPEIVNMIINEMYIMIENAVEGMS